MGGLETYTEAVHAYMMCSEALSSIKALSQITPMALMGKRDETLLLRHAVGLHETINIIQQVSGIELHVNNPELTRLAIDGHNSYCIMFDTHDNDILSLLSLNAQSSGFSNEYHQGKIFNNAIDIVLLRDKAYVFVADKDAVDGIMLNYIKRKQEIDTFKYN